MQNAWARFKFTLSAIKYIICRGRWVFIFQLLKQFPSTQDDDGHFNVFTFYTCYTHACCSSEVYCPLRGSLSLECYFPFVLCRQSSYESTDWNKRGGKEDIVEHLVSHCSSSIPLGFHFRWWSDLVTTDFFSLLNLRILPLSGNIFITCITKSLKRVRTETHDEIDVSHPSFAYDR